VCVCVCVCVCVRAHARVRVYVYMRVGFINTSDLEECNFVHIPGHSLSGYRTK